MQSKAEKKEKRNRKRTEERRSRRRDDLPEDEQTGMCVCFRYRCSPRARRRRRCFPNGRECPAGRTFDQQSGMKRCWPEQNIQSKREGNKRKIGFKFSGFFFPHFTKHLFHATSSFSTITHCFTLVWLSSFWIKFPLLLSSPLVSISCDAFPARSPLIG